MEIKLEFELLDSKEAKVKYSFTKQLLQVSKIEPQLVFKYFKNIVEMLESNNNIFKWTALDVLGYLSAVDENNQIDELLPLLFQNLNSNSLITTNHAIFAFGLVAKNKPSYKKNILHTLMSIVENDFKTKECLNIAIGKVLETYMSFIDEIKKEPQICNFINEAMQNDRPATRKKAQKLIRLMIKN